MVPVKVIAPVDTLYAALVTVAVGGCVSITIAELFDRFCPAGIVVDVMALPNTSVTVPATKLEMLKSAVETFCGTVYVPVSVVPFELAVNVTVPPVPRVTSNVLPAITASDIVAVIFIVSPTPYEPSAVVDVKLLTVGRVVSL